jgi:hypothetical protein
VVVSPFREKLRCKEPAAYKKDRLVLSDERKLHINNTVTVKE